MKRVVPCLCAAFVAAFMMTSCSNKKSLDALEGEWSVVAIGDMVVPDSAAAFLSFDIAEQLLCGYTGCNHLTGTLQSYVDVPKPLFAAVGSTRKWCPDMTIEDALLPALSHVVDFTVDSDTLYLQDSDGLSVVVLVKQ